VTIGADVAILSVMISTVLRAAPLAAEASSGPIYSTWDVGDTWEHHSIEAGNERDGGRMAPGGPLCPIVTMFDGVFLNYRVVVSPSALERETAVNFLDPALRHPYFSSGATEALTCYSYRDGSGRWYAYKCTVSSEPMPKCYRIFFWVSPQLWIVATLLSSSHASPP